MSPTLWITVTALCGGLYALGRWSRRHPHDPWVFALWYLALGPRTDVPHMTRRELFESAGAFVTWTLFTVVALQLLLLSAPDSTSLWVQGIAFGLALFLLMGIGGAAYMLVRALLRRPVYLSDSRFSAELALMPFWIERRDWNGLDGHFRRFAERTCGTQVADAIAAVDLGDYRGRLGEALRGALRAAADRAAVIAYLHRPHEQWTGAFCVYGPSETVTAGERPRMGACMAEVAGPPCVELARLFVDHGGTLNAVALYLIARTVVTLGRCLDEVPRLNLAVCMAFEGDGGLLWLREPAGGR